MTQDVGLTDESTLFAAPGFTFPPIPGSGYSFALPDLCLDSNGVWRLIECNVTNGAGTSCYAADLPRAAHEADTVLAAGPLHDDDVILRAMSPDTRSSTEIKMRSVLLAAQLTRLTGHIVRVKSNTEGLEPGPTVVTGSIPELLSDLTLDADVLVFKNRSVRAVFNPNLITAVALRDGLDLKALLQSMPERLLGEGRLMATLGLDKVLQQELVPMPLMRPVRSFVTVGAGETAQAAARLAKSEGGAVIKPLNASGGVSVLFVNPEDTEEMGLAEIQRRAGNGAQVRAQLHRKLALDGLLLRGVHARTEPTRAVAPLGHALPVRDHAVLRARNPALGPAVPRADRRPAHRGQREVQPDWPNDAGERRPRIRPAHRRDGRRPRRAAARGARALRLLHSPPHVGGLAQMWLGQTSVRPRKTRMGPDERLSI
jgi:hypothetical protein